MSKQDSQRIQSCILKVNIDCNGCAQKVKKLLQKIHGVSSVNIDAEERKVIVTGAVDPAILIKKLNKSGKHAELWGGMDMHNQNYSINKQFQNLQLDNSKGGRQNNKSQNQKGQKGGDMKGAQNLKVVPTKQHKSVKFNLPHEKFDASDDGYDEFHDHFDDYDEDEEEGYGHGVGPAGKMNGPVMKGNGGGGGKKGSVIDPPNLIKGKGGNQYYEGKNGNKKGGKQNGGGDQSDSKSTRVKSIGRLLGFGKKSKKGGGAVDTYNNKDNYNDIMMDMYNQKGQKGGDMKEAQNPKEVPTKQHNYNGIKENQECDGKLEGHGHNGNGNMGQMGPMDMKGLQVMNGGGGHGYHQGMQMQPPQYNQQQQQYLAMMMNQQQQQQQQQAYMNPPEAMMYGRPQYPSMNYMPPPPMPSHPRADPITHTFSDENVDSCSIM